MNHSQSPWTWTDRLVAGTCECGNEPSGSIKCREFLDWLRTGKLLNDTAAWSM
jgi:hypothetical protein